MIKEPQETGKVELPFSLYGGKVTGKFVENKSNGYHAYFVTDEENGIKNKRPKGVTTILGIKDKSIALISWATTTARFHLEDILESGKQITIEDVLVATTLHQEKKEEAANIGDEIHNWCEAFIKNRLNDPEYPEQPAVPDNTAVQIGASAFLDWVKEHNVQFVSSERIVYSRTEGYIGKMDIEAVIDGKLALVDIKSSNGLYNSVRLQIAAYAKADEEETGKKYDTRWALRLAKETEEEYYAREEKKAYGKRTLAHYQGKEVKEYPVKPYQVFEAMEFPDGMESDYKAFLACRDLIEWDGETDFFKLKK